MIRAQRISVNGRIAELGVRVTANDDIRLDGRAIRTRAAAGSQVFIFNRSPGDPLRQAEGDRDALLDRLPKTAGRRFVAVSPMPGIDGGLELVTSDGALAARLQRAIHSLPSEFTVRVRGMLGPDQIAGIQSGKLDRPSRLAVESLESSEAQSEAANRWWAVVTRGASGKDVRQLFERQGVIVSRIQRVAIGSVKLEKSLARGQHRQLEAEEISSLLSAPAPRSDDP